MEVKCVKTGFLQENCYIISIGNDALIIDPGDESEKIINEIGNKNVLAILITHYHFDHIGALITLKKYYNIDEINYKNRINKISNFNFDIIDTKGHKEDCVSYYFKDYNIMFVGDFIFKGSIGRYDMPGGNFDEMKFSIKKIKKYDSNIILYPGHGDKTTIKNELLTNPYLRSDFSE